MDITLIDILAYSCALPAIIGLMIYKKMKTLFHFLVYILLLALITEILNDPRIGFDKPILWVIINIFNILNTLFHIVFFYKAGIISSKKKAYLIFIFLLLLMGVDMLYEKKSLTDILDPLYIAGYAIILLLCIEATIKRTFNNKLSWFTDPVFLYAVINIIYAAFFLFDFSLMFFGVTKYYSIYVSLQNIHKWVNASCYVLIIWPILCTTKKHNYLKLSL